MEQCAKASRGPTPIVTERRADEAQPFAPYRAPDPVVGSLRARGAGGEVRDSMLLRGCVDYGYVTPAWRRREKIASCLSLLGFRHNVGSLPAFRAA